jgi:hypothetical protein
MLIVHFRLGPRQYECSVCFQTGALLSRRFNPVPPLRKATRYRLNNPIAGPPTTACSACAQKVVRRASRSASSLPLLPMPRPSLHSSPLPPPLRPPLPAMLARDACPLHPGPHGDLHHPWLFPSAALSPFETGRFGTFILEWPSFAQQTRFHPSRCSLHVL